MAIIDYKEKYEKAVQAAMLAKQDTESAVTIGILEEIFPELTESEDEKIRKELLQIANESEDSFYMVMTPNKRKRLIAWLEKQGEQKPADVRTIGYWHVEDIEQKLADKPKFKVKYAGSEYNVFEIKDIAGVIFYGIEDEPNHIDYVKADNCEIISGYGFKESGLSFPTKPVIFSEQKSAWSEEDEKCCSIVIAEFSKCAGKSVSKDEWMRCNDWLNSLRDRVQPKQEWSEEDEKMCQETIDWFEKKCFPYALESENPARESIKWLKSLKERYTWKPSEEQIDALEDAIADAVSSIQKNMLNSLYQDIKKLKE